MEGWSVELNSKQEEPEAPRTATKSLQESVSALEGLCKAPPEVTEQFILYFNPIELDAVNAMWEQLGIAAVIERFGEERRFYLNSSEEVFAHALDEEDSSPGLDGSVQLLQIMKFEEVQETERRQDEYYRAARIALSEEGERELLKLLDASGITGNSIPEYDEVTDSSLKGAGAIGLTVGVQWYGPSNIYGSGVELQLSLELDHAEEGSLFVSLSVDESGRVFSKLFSPELLMTGYEGHACKVLELNREQVEVLAKIGQSLKSTGSESMPVHFTGAWIGQSL